METVVTNREMVNQILSLIADKQKDANKGFESLEDIASQLSTGVDNSINQRQLSDQEMIDLVVKAEYLVFKLRVSLAYEQQHIKNILTNTVEKPSATIVAIFKQRDSVIASSLQRLSELRDDISVIQKLLYIKQHRSII